LDVEGLGPVGEQGEDRILSAAGRTVLLAADGWFRVNSFGDPEGISGASDGSCHRVAENKF
jgi:hypothetical protein